MSEAAAWQTPVHALADRAWDEFLAAQPVRATVEGIEAHDARLDDPSPVGRAAFKAMVDGWAGQVEQLDRPGLQPEDRATLGLMRAVVARYRDAHELRLWQFDAVDQIHGPQTLPGELARFQRIDTPERFEALSARLAAFPGWLAAHRANLADGVADGRTAALSVVDRCLDQARRLVAVAAEDSPLAVAAAGLPSERRGLLLEAIGAHVRPALAEWLAMLEGYRRHARPGDGLCHLPEGAALYRHYIRRYTNLDEDPRDIHDYGLARLDEIEAAAASIAIELGQAGVAELRTFLDRDPGNHASDPAAMLALVREWIARAEAEVPAWFGDPPHERCEVRPVEPHAEREAPAGFYYPPAEDGRRPGIYFLNTYDPASRPLHQLVPMTFHEAVPGHHLQLVIERRQRSLPTFRKQGAMLASVAYVEGWALYAERLAMEMGLYRTPLERFGAWESEAHRAARLVVDTGLHAFGWTRQQSIDVLRSRAGLSLLEAEVETDRYIAWPGQALSYMLGQREILRLRAQLETRDGARFDARAFHDELLRHGALPLDVLRELLPSWVQPTAR